MESIGERIKRLREERDLKASDVAKITGIAQSYLSEIETGKRNNPSADVLKKLADYFNTSIDYIIGGEKVPLMDFIHLFPEEEAEYVRSHKETAWVHLVRRMRADELSPESVAQLIEAVRMIKEKKGD